MQRDAEQLDGKDIAYDERQAWLIGPAGTDGCECKGGWYAARRQRHCEFSHGHADKAGQEDDGFRYAVRDPNSVNRAAWADRWAISRTRRKLLQYQTLVAEHRPDRLADRVQVGGLPLIQPSQPDQEIEGGAVELHRGAASPGSGAPAMTAGPLALAIAVAGLRA
jgi:hypothetical protein